MSTRNWLYGGVLSAALTVVGLLAFFPMQVEDIFMYLAIARRFFAEGHFSATDPFLFPLPSYQWHILHEWGSYLVFYGVHSLAGVSGLIGFKTLIVMAACALPLLIGTRLKYRSPLVPLLMVFTAGAASHRFIERSSLFSDLFTALTIYELLFYRRRPSNAVFALVPLFLVWVNLHPAFHLGLFFIGLALLADIRDYREPSFKKLLTVLVSCVAACMVNPHGWDGFWYPVLTAYKQDWGIFRRFNFEWMPTFTSAYGATWEAKALLILMTAAAISLWHSRRRKPVFELLCVGFLIWLGASAMRFTSTSAYALAVLIAWMLAQENTFELRGADWQSWPMRATCAATLVLALLGASICTNGYVSAAGPRQVGTGLDGRFYPIEAAERVDQIDRTGNVFNEWGWGGYLAWRWDGRHRIFYHGHIDDPKFYYNDYLGVGRSEEGFWSTVHKFDIKFFLLDRWKLLANPPPIIFTLLSKPPWRLVHETPNTMLFYREE